MTTSTTTTEESPAPRPRRRRGRSRRGRSRPRNNNNNQPVPLHKRSASHFQRGDRQRGQEYFQQGRVRLEIENTRARAHVEGTDRPFYRVGLDWSRVGERVLHAFCECQRFAKRKPCKHLWATLLAMAEAEPENQPPGRDRVSLRKDRASAWRDLGVVQVQQADNWPGQAPGHSGDAAVGRSRSRRRTPSSGRRGAGGTSWRSQLATVRGELGRLTSPMAESSVVAPDIDYRLLINTLASTNGDGLVIDIFGRKRGARGKPGRLKRAGVGAEKLEEMLRAAGQDEPLSVVTAMPADTPGRKGQGRRKGAAPPAAQVQRFLLPRQLWWRVLPHLCGLRALGSWNGRKIGDPQPLAWDAGPPWQLTLHLEISEGGGARLSGALERDHNRVPLSSTLLILPPVDSSSALVFFSDSIASLEPPRPQDVPWIDLLRSAGEIVIPKEELEEGLTSLLEIPSMPRLDLPENLQLSQESSSMRPRLVLHNDSAPAWLNPPLVAELSYDYGDLRVSVEDPRSAVVDWQEQKFVRRDMDKEHAALVRLLELGFHPVQSDAGHELEIAPKELPAVAEPLLSEGWSVEAHGQALRHAGPPSLKVESGIDWFELSGSMDFEGDPVELAKVLEAISKGDRFIELGDGSKGLLPNDWMETYDSLAQLAHDSSDEGLRFLPSQALLVDALLTMTPVDVDAAFTELREKLRSFDRIKPKRELKTFGGELRGYQRQGLGWLSFLREFGLGGVLADDMGLGKTVQVLALIQAYRTPAKTTKLPSLVVAPRSLVYNWIDEAAKFTPKLKVVEYAGPDRAAMRDKLSKYDILVTTYGTMRRDIGFLATVEFDTVILDEAQAIKNPTSQTAKASSLLVAQHRLALTGTPIENHLGELGSIFEFLNPGLLGRLPKLEVLASGRNASQHELERIAQGIRPFILRRTKAQVLPDLPQKTEQVLFCSLEERQREVYDQVRASYQASLLKQVEAKGVGGSAIQVLEALLRLRQVACHPGLVNEEWNDVGSAKLEALFEHISEILSEGHKILVFSQFTKLLAYVRGSLDEREMPYAYLDGQTRNRAEEVERFQTDPECNLFLVSLKAGGTGLNLTAAEYVFLLDPWWNPAVEAQAIDRAHRIGQTQPVFAYRMIARDTVEEKILELQRSKKKLADVILDGEGTALRDLTADDLRMLLS